MSATLKGARNPAEVKYEGVTLPVGVASADGFRERRPTCASWRAAIAREGLMSIEESARVLARMSSGVREKLFAECCRDSPGCCICGVETMGWTNLKDEGEEGC